MNISTKKIDKKKIKIACLGKLSIREFIFLNLDYWKMSCIHLHSSFYVVLTVKNLTAATYDRLCWKFEPKFALRN